MVKKIIATFFIFMILVVGGAFLYTKNYLSSTIKTPNVLFIPKGSTKDFIKYLKTQKNIDLYWFDYYLLKRYGYPQAGWIDLEKDELSRNDFFYKITHSKSMLQKVTLIPGETAINFLTKLSSKLDLNFQKLWSYYKKITPYDDGVIIADTYSVPKGISEEEIIDYLLEISLKKHKSISKKELGNYNKEIWFSKIITKASIIQKEAANVDEMPIISAVIDNRIKKKMKLQMDATLNYGKYSHIKVTHKRIREDNSKFNTYKNYGLPPSPISSVSIASIQAAIHPKKVDYLYFVKGKNSKHIFSKSYKQHLKNIKN